MTPAAALKTTPGRPVTERPHQARERRVPRDLAAKLKVAAAVEVPVPDAVCVMDVTPDIARAWLERNTHNRPVRFRHVESLARDMHNDRWHYDGSAIRFFDDGGLADGQHRLLAVVDSGRTVPFLVVPGLDRAAQEVVDTGARRSTGDALALRGESNATLLAAVSRLAVIAEQGGLAANNVKPTPQEVLDWIDAHADIRAYVRQANVQRKHFDFPPAVAGFCMWRLAQIDTFEAARFFSDMVEMKLGGQDDPVAALARRFRSASRENERLSAAQCVSLIFRAWNARRRGEVLSRLSVASRKGRIDVPELV